MRAQILVAMAILLLVACGGDESDPLDEAATATPPPPIVESTSTPTTMSEPTSTASTGASETATLAPTTPPSPGPIRTPSLGVLIEDNFDDPAVGLFPTQTGDPSQGAIGYVDGEYQVISDVSDAADNVARPLYAGSGRWGATRIGVDVRFVEGDDIGFVVLYCRSDARSDSGYEFGMDLSRGTAWIDRRDNGIHTNLWEGAASSIHPGNESNHLQLHCGIASSISAYINGTKVASVDDATYKDGLVGFEAGVFKGEQGRVDARFDNFVVRIPELP